MRVHRHTSSHIQSVAHSGTDSHVLATQAPQVSHAARNNVLTLIAKRFRAEKPHHVKWWCILHALTVARLSALIQCVLRSWHRQKSSSSGTRTRDLSRVKRASYHLDHRTLMRLMMEGRTVTIRLVRHSTAGARRLDCTTHQHASLQQAVRRRCSSLCRRCMCSNRATRTAKCDA